MAFPDDHESTQAGLVPPGHPSTSGNPRLLLLGAALWAAVGALVGAIISALCADAGTLRARLTVLAGVLGVFFGLFKPGVYIGGLCGRLVDKRSARKGFLVAGMLIGAALWAILDASLVAGWWTYLETGDNWQTARNLGMWGGIVGGAIVAFGMGSDARQRKGWSWFGVLAAGCLGAFVGALGGALIVPLVGLCIPAFVEVFHSARAGLLHAPDAPLPGAIIGASLGAVLGLVAPLLAEGVAEELSKKPPG